MQAIRAALYAELAGSHPQTIRQVYYALTVKGVVEKTEPQYRTVCRLLADMRRSGDIPYGWIADATRWMRRPTTYSSVEEALSNTARTYRRALWDESATAVEIWVEKDALAGVLSDVTFEHDVPLMVTRGRPSISYLHSAAVAIRERWEKSFHPLNMEGQRTAIYYFGDHDPTGRAIDGQIVKGIGESLVALGEEDLDDWMPEEAFAEFATFQRVAVTAEQITTWKLPTRPGKAKDPNAKRFTGANVELDAIPADRLRALARQCIEQHADQYELKVLRTVEAEERRLLEQMAETWNGGAAM